MRIEGLKHILCELAFAIEKGTETDEEKGVEIQHILDAISSLNMEDITPEEIVSNLKK